MTPGLHEAPWKHSYGPSDIPSFAPPSPHSRSVVSFASEPLSPSSALVSNQYGAIFQSQRAFVYEPHCAQAVRGVMGIFPRPGSSRPGKPTYGGSSVVTSPRSRSYSSADISAPSSQLKGFQQGSGPAVAPSEIVASGKPQHEPNTVLDSLTPEPRQSKPVETPASVPPVPTTARPAMPPRPAGPPVRPSNPGPSLTTPSDTGASVTDVPKESVTPQTGPPRPPVPARPGLPRPPQPGTPVAAPSTSPDSTAAEAVAPRGPSPVPRAPMPQPRATTPTTSPESGASVGSNEGDTTSTLPSSQALAPAATVASGPPKPVPASPRGPPRPSPLVTKPADHVPAVSGPPTPTAASNDRGTPLTVNVSTPSGAIVALPVVGGNVSAMFLSGVCMFQSSCDLPVQTAGTAACCLTMYAV
jgi:hypothetical protein